MARILVTGATGFLGRHLCMHLTSMGHDVYGTSNRGKVDERTFFCDVFEQSSVNSVFEQSKPDIIVHCAAISSVTSSAAADYYRVNTVGTENMINAAVAAGGKKRFILVSTAGVYGNQNTDQLHEELCPKPVHHYGMSKFCAERVLLNHRDNLDYTIVRPFNIIGVGQDEEFIMPKLVNAFFERQPVIRLGNIDVFRDYIDVSDACEIIARLIFNASSVGEICNLCTGRPVSIHELLQLLKQVTGHDIEVQIDPKFVRKNEVWRLLGDATKVEKLTGGPLSGLTVKESLRRMLEAKSAS